MHTLDPLSLTGLHREHLLEDAELGWVNRAVIDDLRRLRQAAQRDGLALEVFSGFRDFDAQARIWNAKWLGQRTLLDDQSQALDYNSLSESERLHAILRWSALPGASRHHWGTDFDLYSPALLAEGERLELIQPEYQAGGCQAPLARWLEQHAAEYGFFYPYQHDLGGVAFEPWHLSHYSCAQSCLAALTPELLAEVLASHPIEGSELVAAELSTIFTRYITNICLPEPSC
ncbi:M15 family metallopeptidase [Aliagarivorans marinus]|uniref:M15 family metallopeptidase n=1 Tax=Aliagarivorans marinus TaxID=561965 RepID=UPI0003FD7FEC|nr:M15 family metallopeptidase [Aliagarivorans marinus]